jgi:hypothetical protein
MLKALDPDKYRESKEVRHVKPVPKELPEIDFSQLPREDLAALERIYERLNRPTELPGEIPDGSAEAGS